MTLPESSRCRQFGSWTRPRSSRSISLFQLHHEIEVTRSLRLAIVVGRRLKIPDGTQAAHRHLAAVRIDADLIRIVTADAEIDKVFIERVGQLMRRAGARGAGNAVAGPDFAYRVAIPEHAAP